MKKKMLLLIMIIGTLNHHHSNGADKKADTIGMTSLHFAAIHEDLPKIIESLKEGINVNKGNLVHMTALHLAAQHGNIEAIDMLLQNGAQVNSLSIAAMTPLDYAKMNHHQEAVTLLTQYGGKETFVQSLRTDSPAESPCYRFGRGDIMAKRKRKREEANTSSFDMSSNHKTIGSFFLSDHAQTRLLARGASEEDVLNTLNAPEKTYIQENGIKIFIGPRWKIVTNPREQKIITIVSSLKI